MEIFAEGDLRNVLEAQKERLRNEVRAESKHRLLNVNETEYLDYLVSKYRIDPLIIHDQASVSTREVMIPAERFPRPLFDVRAGKSYPKQVITYHVPFSGEADLLRYAPSTGLVWSTGVEVGQDSISFDIIDWSDSAEQIKREAEGNLSSIRTQAQHVAKDVAAFNDSLERTASEIVRARKTELLKQSNLLSALGVPIQRAGQIPETFAVPTIKKKVIVKPSAPAAPFVPEPTLDESLYHDILRICHQTGVEMERHPSIYHGKDEETLRDHFIMVLAPHFQSVTGETFNRVGKTDILIRHEKSNIFVAECKFWNGLKAFHEAIDQALGYLTWRDSKAAVLCFVRNKELGAVLGRIETGAQQHPSFVKYRGREKEGWFSFEFHLPDDHSRSVRLAVLCFHFPPMAHGDRNET
jgi:hypothetical protein